MNKVLSHGLFPFLMLAQLTLAYFALMFGIPGSAVIVVAAFSTIILTISLQKLIPYNESWTNWHDDFGVDVLHMVFSTGVVVSVTEGILVSALYMLASAASVTISLSVWPVSLPLIVQLALAIVIGDFGSYWMHRWLHSSNLGWKIHALHHSSEKLYVLSAIRNHPLNVLLVYGSQMIPLALLGAPPLLLALLSVFTVVHGMLQHANLEMRLGVFNRIFSTADYHRWHHSIDMEASNTNYGSNVILWDMLFRTRYLPEGRRPQVGLDISFPRNYWTHLMIPFTWDATPKVSRDEKN